MTAKGTIFIHKKFVYENGSTGEKYLILLNTPGKKEGPYLFVKTTSQEKNKPLTPGCIEDKSLFFIPSKTTYFSKNTWIQLYSLQEFDQEYTVNNSDIKIVNTLKTKMIDEIIDCLIRAEKDDIPLWQMNLLQFPLDDRIQKLKAKWNKH